MNEKLQSAMNKMSVFAGKAADEAGKLAQKGKDAIDCKSIEYEIEKAQCRLGMLAYETLKKGETLDREAAAEMLNAIDELNAKLQNIRQAPKNAVTCKKCGARVRGDAMFCSSCGAKLGM